MESAYEAFQEGTRLLESENPHAAVVALERVPRPGARQELGARDARAGVLPQRPVLGRGGRVRSGRWRSTR